MPPSPIRCSTWMPGMLQRAERLAFHARRELRREGPFRCACGQVAQRGDQLLARQLLLALVVVGAGLHRAHRDDLVAGAGQEQDLRAVGALLELLQPLQAVAAARACSRGSSTS